jgi:hypothetical protein
MSKVNSSSPAGRQLKLDLGSILSQIKFLQGKVLTVIEASYSEERQLKAVKDLVNKMFSEQMTWITQLCNPDLPIWSKDQVRESGVDVDKVEREAEDITIG